MNVFGFSFGELVKGLVLSLAEFLINPFFPDKPEEKQEPPKLTPEEEQELLNKINSKEYGGRYYFCKYCGNILVRPFDLKDYYDSYSPCPDCKSVNSYVFSKHHKDVYYHRAIEIYGDGNRDEELLFDEEIETNPDFDREKYKMHCEREAEYRAYCERSRMKAYMDLSRDNFPKCPTCGSTRIEKISTTSKVVGAATLGLYSKNATCQFVCKYCGYKW